MSKPELPGERIGQSGGRPARTPRIVAAIVAAGGIAPILLYWLLFGWTPTVSPGEAKRVLREPNSDAVLVDVRDPASFAAGHIDGAVNWPLAGILLAKGTQDVPATLNNCRLFLVCEVGMASRQAAWRLRDPELGVLRAFPVRGGIQEWIRAFAADMGARCFPTPGNLDAFLHKTDPPGGDRFDRWRTGPEQVEEFPFRPSPVGEQAAAVLAYFFIKPVYMLLSLVLAAVLWQRGESDLAALRWSMIAFFLGEAACAVNYGLFRETSYLSEYLHSFGMACAFGFFTYAILEGIDRRILKLSEPGERCAAIGLCRRCIKYTAVPCGLKRIFLLITPVLIVVAAMLPTADWQDNSYNTYIFGQLYHYAHLRVFQQFENWCCPLAAAVCLSASLALLLLPSQEAIRWAKIPFAAGTGALGFGLLRMILGGAYDQNRVWYLFWEETTELLFILGICLALWIFRRGLLLVPASDSREQPEPIG